MRDISYSAESVIDDMARDMLSVDTHSVTKTENIHVKAIEFENWEALAYDLALGVASDQELAAGYGVDMDTLHATLSNANFTKMRATKEKEVANLGDGADFTVKMRLIANRATPKLLRRLMSNATEDKDFIKLFETATRLAQLEPEKKEGEELNIAGAGININLYGMPGLEHIGTTQTEPHDITPTTKETTTTTSVEIEDADIVDEEFQWL